MSDAPATPYPVINNSPNFPELEAEVLAYWAKEGVFEQSVQSHPPRQGADNNEYVFYDGPPFANGLPHHGHLLTGFVKDLFARYHTMKGQRVERRFGWDCHGLPAEMGAEKELGISGRKNIVEFGIEKFNEHCRASVMQYRDQWEWYVNRQARWVDFENDYKTMETPFMESVIWAFKELYKKGYIYEGFKVMPYSWAAETVLSASEIRLDDATREKEDKAVTVAFKLKEIPNWLESEGVKTCFIWAWTTTPWTLPSNLALAVSKELDYNVRFVGSQCHIFADAYMPQSEKVSVIADAPDGDDKGSFDEPFKGDKLIGLSYEPLFPYFAGTPNAFRILDGSSFIEEGSGTGVVHMAPGFGEDDQRVCAENGIDVVVPVDGEGRYTDAIYDLPNVTIHKDGSIETRRCIMKPAVAEHASHFVELHTNAAVMETMNDGPLSVEEAKEDFAKNVAHFKEHGYGQWAVFHKESGEFIGRAGLTFMAQSAEMPSAPTLRCCLNEAFWHGGFGGELCFASLYYGFNEKAFESIVAGAHPDNPRAHSMMFRQGMHIEREVKFKRKTGPYFRITKEVFETKNPPLSLRGLNVIKETQGKCEAEPYTEAQLEKYGLANLRIINWLKARGQLIKQEDYKHNYPHCWRTDQPIIYMAMSSWFVDVPQFRDRMVELNQQINWMPDHVKDGRFGKWLENAREWSISRSRFWGCPIPVWRSDNPDNDELYVFGSIKELEEFFGPHMAGQQNGPHPNPLPEGEGTCDTSPIGRGQTSEASLGEGFKINDLHRPYIDQLTKPCPKNPDYTIRRVEDVFDCWFESGSMPYAQVHYPFENKEWFESHFPADFIVEYEAQTRGWFYNMMVLSVALFDRIPFKNCICHGVVLDEQGRKLSKKLQNYMDPKILFDQYGSDALRWFMMSSAIMRGSELLLDAEGKFIHDAIRLYLKPIWNAYSFFTLYANADGVRAKFDTSSKNLMDRYILAKCCEMVKQTQKALDAYDTPTACAAITDFVEVLNNWYIRRNKDRFWNDRKDADKQAAYDTLYTVLHIVCRACAPLLPMMSEMIYRNLTDEQSVHLADWPQSSVIAEEPDLVADMDKVRDVCNTLLSLRSEAKVRTRQPLAKATLYGAGADRLVPYAKIVADEINLKSIEFSNELDAVAEQKLTIFFPVAGKRLGKQMKAVGAAAKQGDWRMQAGHMVVGGVALQPDEYTMQLVPKKVVKGAQALSSNDALVILDLDITPELRAEGTARDVVRLIQQARKDANLNVADRIVLRIEAEEEAEQAIAAHLDYIAEQTLASALVLESAQGSKFVQQVQLEGATITLGFTPAQKDAA